MPSLKERAVVGGYTAGWGLVRRLPGPVAARAFDAGAYLAFWRGGKGTERLRSNLRRVLGPDASPARLEGTTRAALRSYARYWQEVFRLPDMDPDDVDSRVEVVGWNGFQALVKQGPAVLALPHMGNWDVAGLWLTQHGVPFTTVAERLEPAEVFDKFVAFREGLGMEVLALTGGPPPLDVLVERLRSGRSLCLLADRDLSRRGIPVTFFGATATMPAGPALCSIRTGAPVVPTTLTFTPDGWRFVLHPVLVDPGGDDEPARVAAMTQQLASVFEGAIRDDPADWHMLQRLWQDDLS